MTSLVLFLMLLQKPTPTPTPVWTCNDCTTTTGAFIIQNPPQTIIRFYTNGQGNVLVEITEPDGRLEDTITGKEHKECGCGENK